MLEYIVVRYADIVISVTQIIVDNFRRRYPALEHDKFVCITNGFDPEDFKFLSRDKSDRGFTITYAGSIYPQRTPHYFFEALKELLAEMPEVSSEIKISFLGDIDHRISHLFRQDEISDFVCTTGFLNHRETLSRLINSDLLLFIEDQIAISNRLLPAKLFEYIGAKRPILALVEDGSAKDLLEKIGCGVTVPPKDIKAIAQALKMLYMQRQANRHSFEVDHQKISKFYRRNITEQLAKTLDQVVVSNSLRKVR